MPRKKTVAADVSVAVKTDPAKRPTKSKKFKIDDWAHVPAKVRLVWPDEGKVTVELPDGQRYTVDEGLIEKTG